MMINKSKYSRETNAKDLLLNLVRIHPSLAILRDTTIVIHRHLKQDHNVKVICGSAFGYEPAHVGFVGSGLVSSTVCGSSSVLSSLASTALHHVSSLSSGILIVSSFGDRLSFAVALEQARDCGISADMIAVDDCKIDNCKSFSPGALFVNKVAGALAADGYPLQSVSAVAGCVVQYLESVAAISSSNGSIFENQIELYHRNSVKSLAKNNANNLMSAILNMILKDNWRFPTNSKVALLVNNLGSLSVVEQQIVTGVLANQLKAKGYMPVRVYSGTLMTLFNTVGFSITLLNVDHNDLLKWLDASTDAPFWPKTVDFGEYNDPYIDCVVGRQSIVEHGAETKSVVCIKLCIQYACEALISCSRHLDLFDICSGRYGSKLAAAAREIQGKQFEIRFPRLMFKNFSDIFQTIGGTTGSLYAIGLIAASRAFGTDTDIVAWCNALAMATNAIMQYSGARPGQRTMVDSLQAACEAANCLKGSNDDSLLACGAAKLEVFNCDVVTLARCMAERAEQAAAETVDMIPGVGRALSLNENQLIRPDPGAHAVGIWMRAIAEAIKIRHLVKKGDRVSCETEQILIL